MTYGPTNERSELINEKSPGLARLMKCSDGGVVETRRTFQAASAAFIHPARSPTRGSGLGATVDMLTFEPAQAARPSAAAASSDVVLTWPTPSPRRSASGLSRHQ